MGSLGNKVASSVMADKSDLEASWVLQQTLPGGPSEQSSGNREGRPVNLPEESRIINYEVQAGDTVSTIAERLGVSQDTILSANSLRNADFIKQGQILTILPVSGLLHVVENGDSLLYIAIKYGVDTEDILGYKPNNITDPHSLSIGQKLLIPGGRPGAARAATSTRGGTRSATEVSIGQASSQTNSGTASGSFIWPNPGRITQYFNSGHSGLDIAAPYGTPVVAADSGVVVDRESLNWGLGLNLTIDHGNGYSTTYAHLSSFAVGVGETVSKGDMVGRVGSTGLSTGPHNHFQVRRNGALVNPLNVLP